MSNWLSDEEIEAMEDGGLGWTNGSYLHALCAQAKEANRLRAGLEGLAATMQSEINDLRSTGYDLGPVEDVTADMQEWFVTRIRELLEGGE